jgi:Flp pilus assembly protein CpaB
MFQPNPELKKKLLIVVALACGLLAALLARVYIADKETKLQKEIEAVKQREEAERAARVVKKISVLVAARSISTGAQIVSEDVAIREFPEDYIQPGAIASTINIVGVLVQSQILEGEQILRNKLGAPPEKPKIMSEITPSGKRAVTIAVDNFAGLIGLLQQGDYVDALAIISPPQGSTLYTIVNKSSGSQDNKLEKKVVTLPLFQHVQVLAIGSDMGGKQETQPAKQKTGAIATSNTVTLSLNPQESALASFIQEQGKIRLIMRSNADVAQTEVDPVNWDNLFEYLYPKAKEQGKLPVTVEIYRGLQKEVVPIFEGKKK